MYRGSHFALMLSQERVLEIFEHSGALLAGHFRLESGQHSDRLLQSAAVLQFPEYASAIGAEIAARVKVEAIDVVIGPAVKGVILAYEIAKALGARALFGEERGEAMILRPGFKIEPRDRIVVVDDVLVSGESVFKLIDLSHQHQAQVTAIAFIIDCSASFIDFGAPKVSLARIDIPTYMPEVCPMCKEDAPLLVEP